MVEESGSAEEKLLEKKLEKKARASEGSCMPPVCHDEELIKLQEYDLES